MASEPKVGDVWEHRVAASVYICGEYPWIKCPTVDQARRLSAELSAAREMREVEWAGAEARYVCPCCERSKDEGHAPDCRLARLIGGGE